MTDALAAALDRDICGMYSENERTAQDVAQAILAAMPDHRLVPREVAEAGEDVMRLVDYGPNWRVVSTAVAEAGEALLRLPEGTVVSYLGGRLHVHGDAGTDYDEADYMCPNCVTPWKCNGPHLNDQTQAAIAAALEHEPDPLTRAIAEWATMPRPAPEPHPYKPRRRGAIGSPCSECGDTPLGRAHALEDKQ